MRRIVLRFLPWAALMAVAVISVPNTANPQPPRSSHARINAAIRAMEDAREYMRSARHDFCGHKNAALEEIDRAIRQMHEAAACERF